MQVKTLKHIKGSQLSEEILKESGVFPDQLLTITIEVEENEQSNYDDDDDMPPEENFRPEFIAKLEKSREDYKQGRYTECKTEEEIDAFFKEILEADDDE